MPYLAVLWAIIPLAGPAAEWQSLLGNSPFGPAGASPAATAPNDLEFRGVVQEKDVYLVNLFNPATKTSQWIPVNGHAPGLEVQAYDAGTDKVRIVQAGRSLTLPLKQAHVALVQPAPPAVAPPDGEGNPEGKARDERRAEIREMIRARMEGGREAGEAFRNLPPEAQQMIQELRRRRAEGAGQNQAGPGGRRGRPGNLP